MIVGSPMDASGFGTLAGHFTDRPVVTYDPRGAGRNPTDTTPISAEEHADDLHRVIQDLAVGPVDLFASSGGAVNALALVAAHPEDLRRVVAHEPPLAALLPDRDAILAVTRRPARHLREPGRRSRDGQVHPVRHVRRPRHRRLPRPARGRPGHVRDVQRGRRHPHRPADAQHHRLRRLPARPRGAGRFRRPAGGGRRRRVRPADGRARWTLGRRGARVGRRPCSPATTADSSAASTARPATPTGSPRLCRQSWTNSATRP